MAHRLPILGGRCDLGVDLQFAYAAGDKMTVLRTEVDDDYTFVHRLLAVLADTFQPLGYFQIRRQLQVIAGGNPTAPWQLVCSRGYAS